MALKEKIGSEIGRAKSQIEAFQTNLGLIREPQSVPFKAFLGKVSRDMFELTTKYKGLEAPKNKNVTEENLFGNAEHREQEENKVNLHDMKCKDCYTQEI